MELNEVRNPFKLISEKIENFKNDHKVGLDRAAKGAKVVAIAIPAIAVVGASVLMILNMNGVDLSMIPHSELLNNVYVATGIQALDVTLVGAGAGYAIFNVVKPNPFKGMNFHIAESDEEGFIVASYKNKDEAKRVFAKINSEYRNSDQYKEFVADEAKAKADAKALAKADAQAQKLEEKKQKQNQDQVNV